MYGFGGITILRGVKDWATEEMKKMGISSKYGTTKDSGGASAWISLTIGSNLGEGGEGEGRKGVAYSKKWQVSLCVTLHGAETLNIHSYLCVLLWLAVGDLLKLWHERSDNYTQHLTFTLVLIPGVDTVLYAITHECVIYAHVTVTEEGICITWSWKGREHNEQLRH